MSTFSVRLLFTAVKPSFTAVLTACALALVLVLSGHVLLRTDAPTAAAKTRHSRVPDSVAPASQPSITVARQVTATVAPTATTVITATDALTASLAVTTADPVTDIVTPADQITVTQPVTDISPTIDPQPVTDTQLISTTETVSDTGNTDSEATGGRDVNEASADNSTADSDNANRNDIAEVQAELNKSTEISSSSVRAEIASITIATSGQNLNIYTGPGDDYTVVARLKDGATMNVLEVSPDGKWYRVSVGGIGWWGWIAAEFTGEQRVRQASSATDAAAGDVADGGATASENATVNDQETADRGRAGAEDSAASTAAATVDDSSPDNARTEAAANAPDITVPTAVTQPRNMNVRGGPGTNYGVVSVAPSGSQLEILGVNAAGDWYQVRIDELDEPGWVYRPLTDPLGPIDEIAEVPEDEIPEPPAPEPAAAPTTPAVQVTAAAPPPSGAGFFGYGVQAHMLGGGINRATAATSDMGFNWIKQQIQWRDFEGNQGAIVFSELRRMVDAAGGRGISVLFSVVNAPDWAREPNFDSSVGGPPQDPNTLGNFLARLAGDFCGSAVQAIEVWNEQNLHYEWGNRPINPEEYMNLLRVGYSRIKGACPSMLVISGAPTPAGDAGAIAMDDFVYLERMYQNGLAGLADGIGAHPSGYNVPPNVGWQSACSIIQQTGNFFNGPCDTPHHSWSFRSTMEGYREIMVRYGDINKRLWPTEFGWAAGGALHPAYAYANDNSHEEQARWTVEAYQMMRNWGWVGPAFLWNLNFRVIADGTEKAQWGIVRNDYSPLPVYNALQAMGK